MSSHLLSGASLESKSNQQDIQCRSFCCHCRKITLWQISNICENQLNSEQFAHMNCAQCDCQLEMNRAELTAIVGALPLSTIDREADSYDMAMQAELRLQAIVGSTRMNWLEAQEFEGA